MFQRYLAYEFGMIVCFLLPWIISASGRYAHSGLHCISPSYWLLLRLLLHVSAYSVDREKPVCTNASALPLRMNVTTRHVVRTGIRCLKFVCRMKTQTTRVVPLRLLRARPPHYLSRTPGFVL